MTRITNHATLYALSLACITATAGAADLPILPPMPEVPAPLPVNSVPLANSRNAPEVKLDLPIAPGPFEPTWASIEKNYPGTPDWLREAKFGIWVHFGPRLLGGDNKPLVWKQEGTALSITCPDTMSFTNAVPLKSNDTVIFFSAAFKRPV
jgi:hypothetical protein